MNTPTTIIGVIGAGIVLVMTILKMLGDANARKEKERADLNAEIDKAGSATELLRLFNKLRR